MTTLAKLYLGTMAFGAAASAVPSRVLMTSEMEAGLTTSSSQRFSGEPALDSEFDAVASFGGNQDSDIDLDSEMECPV